MINSHFFLLFSHISIQKKFILFEGNADERMNTAALFKLSLKVEFVGRNCFPPFHCEKESGSSVQTDLVRDEICFCGRIKFIISFFNKKPSLFGDLSF